jgi:hypothetical protein
MKEIAKELLRKGLLLNDPELVAMANQLLGEPEAIETKQPAKKGRRKKTEQVETQTVTITNNISQKSGPVKWGGNTWKDTGELGELGAEAQTTPKIALTPRNRPKYQKIEVICSVCNNKVKTDPIHNTEFFKCDRCMRRMLGK